MLEYDWDLIDQEWRSSKRAILAYYVGAWREGESPLDALARALGVESENISLTLSDPTVERDELDELSACLGLGWIELPGLNVQEAVNCAISVFNEKLKDVPPEVLAYFGAPRKLDLLLHNRPIFNESSPVVGRA